MAGFQIAEARAGRIDLALAYANTQGWMLQHMHPAWPSARFDQEFRALVNKDIAARGPFPQPRPPWSNVALDAPLPMILFEDIKASLTNAWRVRKSMPAGGLVAIYGSPGAGKSFYALDVALRVAAGWPVDGRAVKQAPVIYVAAEGANGLKQRVEAWRRHHKPGNLPFAMVPQAIDLLDPNADLPRLINAIKLIADKMGGPPGLIVLDTLAATFAGGDENSNAMVAYINNLATLRDTFAAAGATVVIVHHRPKDQLNDTLRGHGSLAGAVDTILRVDGSTARRVTNMKQKDGENDAPITFELLSVRLGVDEEGEPVFGAVVNYIHGDADKPLKGAALAVYSALAELVAEAEGGSVEEGPWRAQWAAGLGADTAEGTIRKAWQRNRDLLLDRGKVTNEAGEWKIVPVAPPSAVMDFNPASRAAR